MIALFFMGMGAAAILISFADTPWQLAAGIGSFIFQSTTFALPKIFDERLAELATSGKAVGWRSFAVLAGASLAQLVMGWLVDNHSVRIVSAAVAGLQAALFFAMRHLAVMQLPGTRLRAAAATAE